LMRLMATEDSVTGPINIGNPNEFSILELATKVIELTGAKSSIVRRPLPENDPRQRQPDITRARAQLAWEPKTQLKEGLIRTIAYFDNLLGEKNMRELLTPNAP
jgi:UDP-glucuronate decarboxylase